MIHARPFGGINLSLSLRTQTRLFESVLGLTDLHALGDNVKRRSVDVEILGDRDCEIITSDLEAKGQNWYLLFTKNL